MLGDKHARGLVRSAPGQARRAGGGCYSVARKVREQVQWRDARRRRSRHEEGDLLFLSTDVAHDVAVGRSVRTECVVAAVDGSGAPDRQGRKLGAEMCATLTRAMVL